MVKKKKHACLWEGNEKLGTESISKIRIVIKPEY